MLTYLIQAAAAVRNKDGDTSLHGYVESRGLTTRKVKVSPDDEVKFAVLDSIGDILLQNHQVIVIAPDKDVSFMATVLISAPNLEDELGIVVRAEVPIDPIYGTSAEDLISQTILTISASVVPNTNDCRNGGDCKSDGPLGNLRQVADGKSMWDDKKIPCTFCSS